LKLLSQLRALLSPRRVLASQRHPAEEDLLLPHPLPVALPSLLRHHRHPKHQHPHQHPQLQEEEEEEGLLPEALYCRASTISQRTSSRRPRPSTRAVP